MWVSQFITWDCGQHTWVTNSMRNILCVWFTNCIYESLDILQGIVDNTHESRILCVIYSIYELRTPYMSHELYASQFLYVCHELIFSYCNVGCGSCGESWILRVTNAVRDSVQVISLSSWLIHRVWALYRVSSPHKLANFMYESWNNILIPQEWAQIKTRLCPS